MNQNIKILIEMRNTIIEYLTEEAEINIKALEAYNDKPIQDSDPELRRMREVEAIKLRDRITQAHRHIAVIKRMYPNECIQMNNENIKAKSNSYRS